MDLPGSAQPRSSYADPSTRHDALRHGSSSEAQHALASASSSSARTQERTDPSAQSMEREAVALSPDGIPGDASYATVRRPDAGVSCMTEDQLPQEAEQMAQLMLQARVTQYAHLLAELGELTATNTNW